MSCFHLLSKALWLATFVAQSGGYVWIKSKPCSSPLRSSCYLTLVLQISKPSFSCQPSHRPHPTHPTPNFQPEVIFFVAASSSASTTAMPPVPLDTGVASQTLICFGGERSKQKGNSHRLRSFIKHYLLLGRLVRHIFFEVDFLPQGTSYIVTMAERWWECILRVWEWSKPWSQQPEEQLWIIVDLRTLQETNISHQWEKETHLPKCHCMGYIWFFGGV